MSTITLEGLIIAIIVALIVGTAVKFLLLVFNSTKPYADPIGAAVGLLTLLVMLLKG